MLTLLIALTGDAHASPPQQAYVDLRNRVLALRERFENQEASEAKREELYAEAREEWRSRDCAGYSADILETRLWSLKREIDKKYGKGLERLEDRLSLLRGFVKNRVASPEEEIELSKLEDTVLKRREEFRAQAGPEYAERRAALVEKTAKCEDLWKQRTANLHSPQPYLLRRLQDSLETAAAALRKYESVSPPYLRRIEVEVKDLPVYSAEWRPGRLGVVERLDVLSELIKALADSVERARVDRQALELELLSVSQKSQEYLEDYRDWAGAYGWGVLTNIGTEIFASTLGTALDWKQMGPWGLVVEAGWQMWQLAGPESITDPPKATFDPFAADPNNPFKKDRVEAIGVARIWESSKRGIAYEGVKAYIDEALGFAAGGKLRKTGMKNVPDPELLLAEASGRVPGLGLGGLGSPVAGQRAIVAEASSQLQRVDWRGLLEGVGTEVAKNYVQELTTNEAVERFRRFVDHEVRYRATLAMYLKSGELYRARLENLENLQRIYREHKQELIDDSDIPHVSLKKQGMSFETPTRIKVDLWFDRSERHADSHYDRPSMKSVMVGIQGGSEVAAQRRGDGHWFAEIDVGSSASPEALLMVSAIDEHGHALDSNPQTPVMRAYGQSVSNAETPFSGYESGTDQNHSLMLSEPRASSDSTVVSTAHKALDPPEVSVLFLLDTSGSMDGEKFAHAKRGISAYLRASADRQMEYGLMVFSGSIRLVQPLTRDRELIEKRLETVGLGGGTAFARAISEAGYYLVNASYAPTLDLVILSDGQDTEGGDPLQSLMQIAALGADYTFDPIR